MTILQLTSHLDIGGVVRYVLGLSQQLAERGHRVIIASDGGHCEAAVARLGLTHWRLPLRTSAEFSWRVLRSWRALSIRLQRDPVDLIHAHTRVSQVIAERLARQFQIPYVTTWHGIFKRRLGRRLWPCTGHLTVAVSQPVRASLLQDFHVPTARARYIPNGVDPAYYVAVPDGAIVRACRERWHVPAHHPVIGSIGRMASGRVKGFDLLLTATYFLRRMIPQVELVMAGDGPRRPFLEDITEQLRIRECVHFVGSVDDIRVALAMMDVFVFPSRWPEGFGLSLIEAMAAGKPVVATRVGAVPDIVEDGRSGLLVPPEDPAALAEAIARLLNDRAAAARLGAQAQQRVREQFSLARMVGEMEVLYRELCEPGQGTKDGVT